MRRFLIFLISALALSSIAFADIEEAFSALDKGQFAKAFTMFRQYAEQGNAEAQYAMGILYHDGKGVTQNLQQAARWIRKAAEQELPDAQVALGNLYFDGDGVRQDYEAAVKWYLRAAKKGNVDGQFNMGYAYEFGFGVAKDCDKAEYWYGRAASQGDEEAQEILENFTCRDYNYVASLNNWWQSPN